MPAQHTLLTPQKRSLLQQLGLLDEQTAKVAFGVEPVKPKRRPPQRSKMRAGGTTMSLVGLYVVTIALHTRLAALSHALVSLG